MALIATALVLTTVVGSGQDSAQAIDPADADTVYIADGTDFADALMGATIASLNTSPMLGVAPDTIPGDTEEELNRLTNNKSSLLDTIYIFGGQNAVSVDVANQLGQWANSVQRIEGDTRWGTYQAISEMLPSAIDEAVHAQEADHAREADNADTVDGIDSKQLQLPDALPTGRTLRGYYSFDPSASSAGHPQWTGVSFPVPLPESVQAHFIPTGETPPAACPGNGSNPEADPGHLCVYETRGGDYDRGGIVDFVNDANDQANRFGFTLNLIEDDADAGINSNGTWAVTAP